MNQQPQISLPLAIALMALAFYAGIMGERTFNAPPEPAPCVVLVPGADNHDATDQLALAQLDYSDGVWRDDKGATFGYSASEDSAIYDQRRCTK